MKDTYIYEAEYISKVNGDHFLNIDLGFRTWRRVAVAFSEEIDVKVGERLLVETRIINKTRHKPHRYICQILKIEQKD